MTEMMIKHRAKMKRKADRVLEVGFTPVEGRLFSTERLSLRMGGQYVSPNLSAASKRRYTGISGTNRWTGKPHLHKREIARLTA